MPTERRIAIEKNVVAYYARGNSLRDCACLFGYSHEGIRGILLRNGIKLKPAFVHGKTTRSNEKKYTLAEIIKETQGAYGHEQFKKEVEE